MAALATAAIRTARLAATLLDATSTGFVGTAVAARFAAIVAETTGRRAVAAAANTGILCGLRNGNTAKAADALLPGIRAGAAGAAAAIVAALEAEELADERAGRRALIATNSAETTPAILALARAIRSGGSRLRDDSGGPANTAATVAAAIAALAVRRARPTGAVCQANLARAAEHGPRAHRAIGVRDAAIAVANRSVCIRRLGTRPASWDSVDARSGSIAHLGFEAAISNWLGQRTIGISCAARAVARVTVAVARSITGPGRRRASEVRFALCALVAAAA